MKILLWIIHHFIRPLWSLPIMAVFNIITRLKIYEEPRLKDRFNENLKEWDMINNLTALVIYFKKIYMYRPDGKIGELDHDNSKLEFFTIYGDCDDAARYAMKKLRQLKYRSLRIHMWKNIFKVGIKEFFLSMHYATVFWDNDNCMYVMNYGTIRRVTSLKAAIYTINPDYVNANYCLW